MHMKWPHGTGREAGIGRTRNGKELSAFRACPWWLALRKVTPRRSKRVGPLRIIVVVVVVVGGGGVEFIVF